MACDVDIPAVSAPVIRLPGGVTIAGAPASPFPTKFEVASLQLGGLMAALAPFAPVFRILDAVVAIKDFATALLSALQSFPPNLGKISAAFSKLQQAVGSLATLAPQLSVPLLVRDAAALLEFYVDATLEVLASIDAHVTAADEATAQAGELEQAGNAAAAASLRVAAECNQSAASGMTVALTASTQSLNSVVEVLNFFLSLIPGGLRLPSLGASSSVAELRSALESFKSALGALPI